MGPLFRIRNDSGIEFWYAFWCVSDFSVLYMISGSDFFFFFFHMDSFCRGVACLLVMAVTSFNVFQGMMTKEE